MFELIYASTANNEMSDAALEALLDDCRERNARDDITGMLLYQNGDFIQVLEGERAAVTRLFGKIERDPRHRRVLVLSQHPIAQRSFGDWSMGFRRLEIGTNPAADDVFQLTRDSLFARIPTDAPLRTAAFLRSFYSISGGAAVYEPSLL